MPSFGEIGGANQTIVAGTYDHCVIISHQHILQAQYWVV